jgi:hypothetical protein
MFGLFSKRKVYFGDILTRIKDSGMLVYQHFFTKNEMNELLEKFGFSAKWIPEENFNNPGASKKLFGKWNVILCKK